MKERREGVKEEKEEREERKEVCDWLDLNPKLTKTCDWRVLKIWGSNQTKQNEIKQSLLFVQFLFVCSGF